MAKLELRNITKKFGDFYAANNISSPQKKGSLLPCSARVAVEKPRS